MSVMDRIRAAAAAFIAPDALVGAGGDARAMLQTLGSGTGGPYRFGRGDQGRWEAAASEVSVLRAALNMRASILKGTRCTLWRAKPGPAARRRSVLAEIERQGTPDHRRETVAALRDAGELLAIDDHPIYSVLHGHNGYHSGPARWWMTEMLLGLVGEVYWVQLVSAAGVPIGSYLVPASWRTDNDGAVGRYRFVHGGFQLDVPADHVVRIAIPDTSQPYRDALGAAQTLATDLETDDAAAEHMARHFRDNGGKPTAILTGRFSPTQIKALRRDWRASSRSDLPQFFDNGTGDVKLHQWGYNAEQLQWAKVREVERRAILLALGVPAEALGDFAGVSDPTMIPAARRYVVATQIEPRLDDLRAELAAQLLPRYPGASQFATLEFSDLRPVDDAERIRWLRAAPYAYQIAEIRRMQGRRHLPGSDVHLVRGGHTVRRFDDPALIARLDEETASSPTAAHGGLLDLPLHSDRTPTEAAA